MVDFLTKPVRGDELLETVQSALAWDAAERQKRRRKRELAAGANPKPARDLLRWDRWPGAAHQRAAPEVAC